MCVLCIMCNGYLCVCVRARVCVYVRLCVCVWLCTYLCMHIIYVQLWALVHSTSLPPGNGIAFHSLFVAQTLYLPSKSGLKLTISSWLSNNWKVNWNSPGG